MNIKCNKNKNEKRLFANNYYNCHQPEQQRKNKNQRITKQNKT